MIQISPDINTAYREVREVQNLFSNYLFSYVVFIFLLTIPFAFIPSMKQIDVNGLSPIQTKILMVIKENPTFTMKEISAYCQLGTTRVGEVIRTLKAIGKIKRIGGNKGGYWEVN